VGEELRLQSTATTPPVVAWQVGAVVASGLALAWLVGHAPGIFVLGAVLAFVLGAVFIQRPDAGLMLLLVARASTDASLGSFSSAIESSDRLTSVLLNPNSALILILVVAGGLFLLRHGLAVINLPVVRVYGLLLVIGLIGIPRSHNLFFSLNEWLRVVSPLIVYCLVAHLFGNRGRTQKIIDALALSFILPAIFGFYQLIVGQGHHLKIGVTRILSTFTHPNPFAAYLVIILSVFLCQALDQQGKRKWLSLGVAVASSVLLLGTFARFAWVGAAVVVFTIGLLRGRILLVIFPLIAVIVFGTFQGVGARLEDPMQDSSLRDRLMMWESTFDGWIYETSVSRAPVVVVLDRVTGLGPGAYAPISLKYVGRVIPLHNDYLRLLVEYGLFGLIVYVGLYFMLIRLAYRAWRRSDGSRRTVALSLLALTLAYPVMSMTANLFAQQVNQVYFWALAGLLATMGGASAGTSRQTDHPRSAENQSGNSDKN